MISFNPSAATPLLLLMGVVATVGVHQAFLCNASLFEAEGAARRAAEQALAEVKVLRGLLPICSYCKKVRGDENYWEQIESYVSEHSDAQFSHSICPECQDGVRKELDRWRTRA